MLGQHRLSTAEPSVGRDCQTVFSITSTADATKDRVRVVEHVDSTYGGPWAPTSSWPGCWVVVENGARRLACNAKGTRQCQPVQLQPTYSTRYLAEKGLVAAVKLYKDAVPDYTGDLIPNSFTDNQLFSNWASMGSLPMAPDVREGDDTPVHTVASRWSKQLSIVKSAIMMSVTEEALKG